MYSILPYAHFNEPAADTHPDDDEHDVYAVNRQPYVVAHLNPIITLAMWFLEEIRFSQACMFWVSQFFGCTLASMLLVLAVPDAANSQIGATVLSNGTTWWQGLLMEAMLTCFLTLAAFVFLVRSPKGFVRQNSPLLFGLAYLTCNLVGSSVTGASMNPARSLGPALIGGTWTNHWVYWIGPAFGVVGGIFAIRLMVPKMNRCDPWGCVAKAQQFPVMYDAEWDHVERHGGTMKDGHARDGRVVERMARLNTAESFAESAGGKLS